MLDINTLPKDLLTASPAGSGLNIISPIARLSFPVFFTPKTIGDKADSKALYSCSLLIPPNADLTLLKKAAVDAARERWGDKVQEMITSRQLKVPFLRAEDKKYDGYLPGWTLIRASSQTKPAVRDAMQVPGSLVVVSEDNPEIIYPGRWAQVTLNAYSYDQKGNKGVTFGLNNVMLLHHDESFSGRAKAEDEFVAPIISGATHTTSGAPASTNGTIEGMFY